MCDFMSWIEYNGELYYLTDKQLKDKRGLKLKKYIQQDYKEEIIGHGAIRYYYDIPNGKGKNVECTDFSTQKIFPEEIRKKLKLGMITQFGLDCRMLSQSALAEYKKIWQFSSAEYEKIRLPAFWDLFKVKKNRSKGWK